jgi:hypothetical protein
MDYWRKQAINKPLFEDIVWSKPQQKALSGKLLIVGGNLHAVGAPAEAYDSAIKQGVGECKVVMPSATKKFFGAKPPEQIMLVSSTPSGSFSSQASDELKSYVDWADAVLLAGDFGHNSETTVLLEAINKFGVLQVYCGDAIDNLIHNPELLLQNHQVALVVSPAQLQKLVVAVKYPRPLKLDMPLMQLVEFLHDFTAIFPSHLVINHTSEMIVASGGQIVTTKLPATEQSLTQISATSAVWWLQNPTKPLQALATAIIQLS